MRHGIDVSKHNGTIDWAKVKASNRVNFAILRAGFGKVASQKDTKFEQNYQGCVDNNIPVGVYWYSYAKTVDDAIQEAKVCLQVLGGRKLQFPVYFDLLLLTIVLTVVLYFFAIAPSVSPRLTV